MRNFVKSAQDRVTLVLITAIQHHSIPDFRYQHGSVCQGCVMFSWSKFCIILRFLLRKYQAQWGLRPAL